MAVFKGFPEPKFQKVKFN